MPLKREKIKELLQGEDLYQKLALNLRTTNKKSPLGTINAITPAMTMEKIHSWSYKGGPRIMFYEWKGVFLTENNEAGLFHLTSGWPQPSDYPCSLYLAYIANNKLVLQKNKLDFELEDKRTLRRIIKQDKFYSLYFDEVYNQRKKIEKINHDIDKGFHQNLAKQLIKQKIRRFPR